LVQSLFLGELAAMPRSNVMVRSSLKEMGSPRRWDQKENTEKPSLDLS
jgi:hypothetical protein